MNLLLLLVFVAVSTLVITFASWWQLRSVTPSTRLRSSSLLMNSVHPYAAGIGGWLGPVFLPPASPRRKGVNDSLVGAALDNSLSADDIAGLSGILAFYLGFLGLALFMGAGNGPAVASFLFFALFGWIYPSAWIRQEAQKRREAISHQLPFAIDLITVSMQAGQDFMAAIRTFVREYSSGPLPAELARALQEADLGKGRMEALRDMAARIKIDEFQSLVGSVAQSYEMGSSIAENLKVQADLLRKARQARAERKAARAPSLMMIPVIIFIVPAFFMILVVPVIMRMANTVSGL